MTKAACGATVEQAKVLAQIYSATAEAIGLSHPVGRGAYAANRRLNGERRSPVGDGFDILYTLVSCRIETARRWERHIANGGSYKALKYTEAQWKAVRAAQKRRARRR